MEEIKTNKDKESPFRANRLPAGEVKQKLNALTKPLGFTILGSLAGAGAVFLASQYVWADNTANPTPDAPENCDIMQQQTLPPPNPSVGTADVCTTNLDQLPFGKAFAAARSEIGAGGVFIWHGRPFNTFFKEEWANMSQAEKTDFNTSVANLNAEIKDVVDQNGYQAFSGAQSVIDANDYPNPDKDDVNTNTINNPPVNNLDDSSSSDPSHVPYDMDGDGYFETIVFLDANGNIETIAIDTDGSGSTETRIESDGTIIGILPADESDWEEEESEYDVEEEPFIDIYDVMEENTPPADSYTDYNQFISDDFNPNADISEFI